jgi:hypothetical protein
MSAVEKKLRACLQLLLLALGLLPCAACVQPEAPAVRLPELEKLAEDYQIEIVTSGIRFPLRTLHGVIQGRNANRDELQDYVQIFTSEFALYPLDVVRRSQLKTVVLCCDLTLDGHPQGGFPEYEHATLFLNIDSGLYDKTYLRRAVHHEFFHVIDYLDDGNVYEDERWARLNPPKFGYGGGGRSARDLPETLLLTDKFPGFLNHYSTTGVEEDKAELFANLIVDVDHVEDRAKQDPVLQDKVKLLKALLERFCPEMNDKFWQDASAAKRAEK